jgi:hypothetical protein
MTHVSHLYDTYFDLFHILWPIVEPTVDYMNMNEMKFSIYWNTANNKNHILLLISRVTVHIYV